MSLQFIKYASAFSFFNKKAIPRFLILSLTLFCLLLAQYYLHFVTTREAIEPERVLLISSTVKDGDVLAAAAKDGVHVIVYDARSTSLDDLLSEVRLSLEGRKAKCIGIVAHDYGEAKFYLTGQQTISLASTLASEEQREFWKELGSLIEKDGRIDLFACNLAKNEQGKNLVSLLENVSGVAVAASINNTGNVESGGDWLLEICRRSVAEIYFDKDILVQFSGLFMEEDKKIVAFDATAEDKYGHSVAIWGNYAVVGAYNDDDAGESSGSAYIYYRNKGGIDNWSLVKKLTASDAAAGDYFGWSVAISEDIVLIGAHFDDDAGSSSGSAYIFHRNQGGEDNWGEVKKLTASDAAVADFFGYSVALSESNAIIGAYGSDATGNLSGSAYIFNRYYGGSDNWGEVQKLANFAGNENDYFGISVAINGDYAIVGAHRYDFGGPSGAAYIYHRSYGGSRNWEVIGLLQAHDASPGDSFGFSVAISENFTLVGAPGADNNSGSAYLFRLDGALVKKITATDAASDDYFGYSVDISGNYVLIGAHGNADTGSFSGSAYLFNRMTDGTGNWGELKKIVSSDIASDDFFGVSAAIFGNAVLVGAQGDDDAGSNSGSAYFFQFGKPEVSSPTTNAVTANTAVLGGTVDSEGDATVTERGVVWSTNPDPTLADNDGTASTSGTLGSFTVLADALMPATTYHYRAYAKNNRGTTYTDDATFVTNGLPLVTNPSAGDITGTTATLSGLIVGDGGSALHERGIIWGTTAYPDLTSNSGRIASPGNYGSFSVIVSGLSPNTTYHYRAYAINTVGIGYSVNASFTTSPSLPSLSKPTVKNIAVKRAVLGATVDSAGSSPITSRGVVWSTNPNPTTASFKGKKEVAGTIGTFSTRIKGLTSATTYYFRAFAENSHGVGYSPSQSFTTADASAPPENVSVSPDSSEGMWKTFTARYRDPNGADDLRNVYFKISRTGASAACAYVRYAVGSGQLCLRNNAGTAWSEPVAIGKVAYLSNDQVSIKTHNVSVEKEDSFLSLRLPMVFESGFNGPKNLYMLAFDKDKNSSGWQKMGSFTVGIPNEEPENISVTPESGAGAWKTFRALYRDPDGAEDLKYTYFMVRHEFGASSAVYLRYRAVTRKLDLRNDSGSGWIMGQPIGTNKYIFNNQVVIKLKYVKVTMQGTDMTLQLPLRFISTFAGTKNIYMYCLDKGNLNSGWRQLGTFTVTAAAPAGSCRGATLSSLNVDKNDEIDFGDHARGVDDAVWFVNGRRLPVDDATYRFSRRGLHTVEMFGRDADGEAIVSATDLLVGEELIKAGDLVTWEGITTPIRIRKEGFDALILSELSGKEEQILRLRGVLKPGMRLVFNRTSANDYRFIKLKAGDKSGDGRWIYGRMHNGKERTLASKTTALSDVEQILTLKLDAKRGTLRLLLNRKPVFSCSLRLRGDQILLIPANQDDQMDIIVSKPN